MNEAEITALARGFAPIVKAEIARLERRIAELEGRRTMAFKGPHDPAFGYRSGDCVQRQGSLFVALLDTSDVPGQSTAWRRIGSAS